MGIIYGFVLLFGIALPAEHANNETITQWWHPVLIALAVAAGGALFSFVLPRLVGAFAIGTAIGSAIGIVGAPFWHHPNQEAGLSAGVIMSLLVYVRARKTLNQRAYDLAHPSVPEAATSVQTPYLAPPPAARPVRTLGRPQNPDGGSR